LLKKRRSLALPAQADRSVAFRSILVAALLVSPLTSCTKSGSASAVASTTFSATTSSSAHLQPVSSTRPLTTSTSTSVNPGTVTSTVTLPPSKSAAVTPKPPPSTREPAPVTQDCPYVSTEAVKLITGQREGPAQIIQTTPYVICLFYRTDGQWSARVRIIQAATSAAAVAAVNQHVPVATSDPADQPAGWTGGSFTTGQKVADSASGRSIYAVSKGTVAIVVEENETPSIKARLIAQCALSGAKLSASPAPASCSGTE